MSEIRVGLVSPGSPEWNHFVTVTPNSTHMHLAEWATVIERTFGHRTKHFVASSPDGEVCGILPLTYVKSAIFGRKIVSVPFLNYGGPIGSTDAIEALVKAAKVDAKASGYGKMELRSRSELPIALKPQIEKVTVILPLPGTYSELLKSFDSKLRNQIRRASKEGAVDCFGLDQLDGFYDVFSRNMRDLGTPVMPKQFFEEIVGAFSNSVWIATVRLDGTAIAGAIGFRWRDEFEITWASSLASYKRISPNMQMYSALMSRCIDEGVSSFNFGRTTPGSGPHRFKLQWGGGEVPLNWYYPLDEAAPQRMRKEQTHFRYASKVWSTLPLSVANVLGPLIVRGLP